MSEKFGLDWKKFDHLRLQYFMEIMRAESKKAERDSKKK
jgi:hypothetical protein